VTDEIRLDDEEYALTSSDVQIETRIEGVLRERIQTLVTRCRQESFTNHGTRNKVFNVEKPEQVLIRLKVDRHGFQTINTQRLGAQFVGDVANPSDLVLFHQRRTATEAKSSSAKSPSASDSRMQPTLADELEEFHVEDLITQQLESSNKKLTLLKESTLKDALEDYVKRQHATALADLVETTLAGVQQQLKSTGYRDADNIALIQKAVESVTEKDSQSGKSRGQRSLQSMDCPSSEDDADGRPPVFGSSQRDEPDRKRVGTKRRPPPQSETANHGTKRRSEVRRARGTAHQRPRSSRPPSGPGGCSVHAADDWE